MSDYYARFSTALKSCRGLIRGRTITAQSHRPPRAWPTYLPFVPILAPYERPATPGYDLHKASFPTPFLRIREGRLSFPKAIGGGTCAGGESGRRQNRVTLRYFVPPTWLGRSVSYFTPSPCTWPAASSQASSIDPLKDRSLSSTTANRTALLHLPS